MRRKIPTTAESIMFGFLLGLIAGVLRDDIAGGLAQGFLAAIILGLLRVALGIVYDAATGTRR